MDTPSSQKRSPRSSAKNERQSRAGDDTASRNRPTWMSNDDADKYLSSSSDIVSRVREAREAAQRAMESFGDVSEYEITTLQGQARKESNPAPTQPALEFEAAEESEAG